MKEGREEETFQICYLMIIAIIMAGELWPLGDLKQESKRLSDKAAEYGAYWENTSKASLTVRSYCTDTLRQYLSSSDLVGVQS